MKPSRYPECCICHKMLDEYGKEASEFSVHGRGSGKVVNYFHKSCFYELGKRNKELTHEQ